MLRAPDGVAFARAAGLGGDGSKAPQAAPLTEMRVTLAVTENGRPVPTKSDGARFAAAAAASAAAGPRPLDVTLKLRQGATYCLSLTCAAAAAAAASGPRQAAPQLESASATVWTRCARPPAPPASAQGLHEVLGLLCWGCCGGGGGGGGRAGGAAAAAAAGAAAGGGGGGEASIALVGAAGGNAAVVDSASGGGSDDDGYSGGWRGGAQVAVSEKGGSGSGGGGGGGGLSPLTPRSPPGSASSAPGAAASSSSRFELFWTLKDGEVEVTPDGARTEIAVELVFAGFGRARLTLLCKVGGPLAAAAGAGSAGSAAAAAAHLRPSGAVFHLLRSAMTGEVRVLSRVPL